MKILQVISSSGMFGAENMALNLTKALLGNGHHASLVCIKNFRKPDPEIYIQARKSGLSSEVVSCNGRFDIKAVGKIRELISQNGIGLIHSHGYKSNLYSLMASRMTGVPIVATLHGWTGETKWVKLYDMLDRWLIKKMDYLIAVSPTIEAALKKDGAYADRAKYIPNAVDPADFDPEVTDDIRDEFGIDSDSIIIGVVGRLGYEKGHIYLIKAFKEIRSQIEKVKLLIVGDGYLREGLYRLTVDLGISGDVIFAGVRRDMAAIYKSIDIFAMPSISEGLPMALLEAMSMGCSSVASGVGAIPEVIAKGEGLVVSPGDIDELKNGILSLIKDSSLRKAIGKKARSKVISNFSIGPFCRKYIEVYENVYAHN